MNYASVVHRLFGRVPVTLSLAKIVESETPEARALEAARPHLAEFADEPRAVARLHDGRFVTLGRTHALLQGGSSVEVGRIPEADQEHDPPATVRELTPVEKKNARAHVKHGRKAYRFGRFKPGMAVTWNGERWIVYDARARGGSRFTLMLVSPDYERLADDVQPADLGEGEVETSESAIATCEGSRLRQARTERVILAARSGQDRYELVASGPQFFVKLNGEAWDYEDGELQGRGDETKPVPADIARKFDAAIRAQRGGRGESVDEAKLQHGDRVRIHYKFPRTEVGRAFQGKVGTISGEERDGRTRLFRVRFQPPILVPGVGPVTSDLWAAEFLRPVASESAGSFSRKKFGDWSVRMVRGTLWLDDEKRKVSYYLSQKHGEFMAHHERSGSGVPGVQLDDLRVPKALTDFLAGFVAESVCVEGKWRTTKRGHRIYIDRGRITKGNPHVLKAVGGERRKESIDEEWRAEVAMAYQGERLVVMRDKTNFAFWINGELVQDAFTSRAAALRAGKAYIDSMLVAVESVDEAQAFSAEQIEQLRAQYAQIGTVDPTSPTYAKMIALLDRMSQAQLKQLSLAKIKFLSGLARNRIVRARPTSEARSSNLAGWQLAPSADGVTVRSPGGDTCYVFGEGEDDLEAIDAAGEEVSISKLPGFVIRAVERMLGESTKKDMVKAALHKRGTYTAQAIDQDEYPPIKGLEGPFRTKSGRVVYYDPKAGLYYDSKTDIYLDRDFNLHDSAEHDEGDECEEGIYGPNDPTPFDTPEQAKAKQAARDAEFAAAKRTADAARGPAEKLASTLTADERRVLAVTTGYISSARRQQSKLSKDAYDKAVAGLKAKGLLTSQGGLAPATRKLMQALDLSDRRAIFGEGEDDLEAIDAAGEEVSISKLPGFVIRAVERMLGEDVEEGRKSKHEYEVGDRVEVRGEGKGRVVRLRHDSVNAYEVQFDKGGTKVVWDNPNAAAVAGFRKITRSEAAGEVTEGVDIQESLDEAMPKMEKGQIWALSYGSAAEDPDLFLFVTGVQKNGAPAGVQYDARTKRATFASFNGYNGTFTRLDRASFDDLVSDFDPSARQKVSRALSPHGFSLSDHFESVDEAAQLPKSPHKGKPWDDVVALGKGSHIVKIWRMGLSKWGYMNENPQGGGGGTTVETQSVMAVLAQALRMRDKPKRVPVVVGARKSADPFEVATAFWFNTETNLPESIDEASTQAWQVWPKGETASQSNPNYQTVYAKTRKEAVERARERNEAVDPKTWNIEPAFRRESIEEAKAVPPIDSPIYRDVAKLPRYNAKVSPLSAHGSDGGRLLAQRLPGWTKADHAAAAAAHEKLAVEMEKQWSVVANEAAQATWGRDYRITDYRISGIASDEFAKEHKDELRRLAQTLSAHKDAAHAHKAATRMRSLAKEDIEESTYYLIRRDDGKFLNGADWEDEDPGFGFRDMATARKAASAAVVQGKLSKGKFQIVLRDTDDVDETEGDFGVRWSEVDGRGRKVSKERFFTTAKARDAFAEKLDLKDSFIEILAWSDPPAVGEAVDEPLAEAEGTVMAEPKAGDLGLEAQGNEVRIWLFSTDTKAKMIARSATFMGTRVIHWDVQDHAPEAQKKLAKERGLTGIAPSSEAKDFTVARLWGGKRSQGQTEPMLKKYLGHLIGSGTQVHLFYSGRGLSGTQWGKVSHFTVFADPSRVKKPDQSEAIDEAQIGTTLGLFLKLEQTVLRKTKGMSGTAPVYGQLIRMLGQVRDAIKGHETKMGDEAVRAFIPAAATAGFMANFGAPLTQLQKHPLVAHDPYSGLLSLKESASVDEPLGEAKGAKLVAFLDMGEWENPQYRAVMDFGKHGLATYPVFGDTYQPKGRPGQTWTEYVQWDGVTLGRPEGGKDWTERFRTLSRKGNKWAAEVAHSLANASRLSRAYAESVDEMGEARAFRVSPKDPATMTAGEINKELDKLDQISSGLTSQFIEMGRGDWKQSDIRAKAKTGDELSAQHTAVSDRQRSLSIEIELRYGPGAPSRLPKGFGPRKKNESVDEMAKLSAGGRTELMRASKETAVTDDEAVDWRKTTRAWMDDGKVLEKHDVNFKATGSASYQQARRHSYGWKVTGRIKADLMSDPAKLKAALTSTRDKLKAAGWAIESFNPPA